MHQTETDHHRLQQLEQMFGRFNELSGQLESSYSALEQRVQELTAELKQSRHELDIKAEEAETLATRLSLLLDTLPAGVIVVDEGGRVQQSNRVADELLGQALTGCRWQSVAGGAFSGQTPGNGDCMTALGRQISVFQSRLADDGGRVLLLTDVTATRALEELVNRNDRLREMGQMAATLAHQIRTPLASAMLYFSQCRDLVTEPRAHRLLQGGVDSLHSLERMVRDMLVFVRGISIGEEFYVAEIFREVYAAVSGLELCDKHLTIDGSDVLLKVRGNRSALVSALLNLVTNSFESADSVIVSLRAERRGHRVEISVEDDGPGIAAEIRTRVCEPFFSTRPAGTGLGLAVVKTVADAHGAELAFDSGQERGTRVRLQLILVPEKPVVRPLVEPQRSVA
jgi:two-component system sensor histidine kinase FlrB